MSRSELCFYQRNTSRSKERGLEQILLQLLQRKHSPTNTLILDFQLPELIRQQFSDVVTQSVVLCYNSPSKLIHDLSYLLISYYALATSKFFKCVISFNTHHSPNRYLVLLAPFCKEQNTRRKEVLFHRLQSVCCQGYLLNHANRTLIS